MESLDSEWVKHGDLPKVRLKTYEPRYAIPEKIHFQKKGEKHQDSKMAEIPEGEPPEEILRCHS